MMRRKTTPETPAATETTPTKQRKPRYGKAYTSLRECMSDPNGKPAARLFTIEVKVTAPELCIMATSRAQALRAACELVFGEPRRTTDKDQCTMMQKEFVAQAASNGTKT